MSILNANESEAAHAKNGWFGFELFNELLQLRFLRFGVGCSHCYLEPLILSHSIINADIEIQKPYHFSNACNVYSQSSWPTLFPTSLNPRVFHLWHSPWDTESYTCFSMSSAAVMVGKSRKGLGRLKINIHTVLVFQ